MEYDVFRAGEVNIMLELAKKLRRESTEAEQLIWHFLRNKNFCGCRFKRQHIIKPYIVDFVCLGHKLIIEVDGSQHLDNQKYDNNRTKYLESLGYCVIRFWNNDVLQNTCLVLETIFNKLEGAA